MPTRYLLATKRDGEAIGNLDLMIAAHAMAAQAVLVTNEGLPLN